MKDIAGTIAALNEQGDYFGIIRLIEKQDEPDYGLTLDYARACINAANSVQDGYALLEQASRGLDSWAAEGRGDARWLFYKGYVLYKQGMVPDALNRFELALGKVPAEDPHGLFPKIRAMAEACRQAMIESEFKGPDEALSRALEDHVRRELGDFAPLATSFKVRLLRARPTQAHPYNMLVTSGLAARRLPVPDGFDRGANSRLELCLPLPEDYDFRGDKDANWEVFLMLSLIEHVISSDHFIGFGYFIGGDRPFAKGTAFCGAMLTALGDYGGSAQELVLKGGDIVRYFQVVPLLPMECRYRESHSAMDLLEVFASRKAALTPFCASRSDACAGVDAAMA
ncbi:MAG: suppressor of fused domain protein [Succinivibrio sp.]